MEELIRIQLRGPVSANPLPLLVDASRKLSTLMPLFLRKLGLPNDLPVDVHHAESRSILDPALPVRQGNVRENHVLVLLPRAAPPPASPKGKSGAIPDLEEACVGLSSGKTTLADVEALFPAAAEAALSSRQKIDLARTVGRRKLAAAESWAAGLLQDADAAVRRSGLQVLMFLRPKDRAEEIKPLLSDPSGGVRGEAALLLARLGRTEIAPVVRAMLEDPDPGARSRAAKSAEWLPMKGREAKLRDLLRDPHPTVRAAAVSTLAELDSPMLHASLPDLFRDPEPEVRRSLCQAAVRLDAREVAPHLVACLRDPDESLRREAIRAVGMLDAREATEDLRRCLDATDEWLLFDVLEALTALGTVEPGDVARFSTHESGTLRSAVVAALEKSGSAREIAPFLSDPDPGVQVRACGAVGEIRRLEEYLAHPQQEVRRAALDGLARRNARDAGPRVVPLLQDTDRFVRGRALQTLEHLDYLPAIPSLPALLDDPDGTTRGWASLALRGLGAAEACPDLRRLLPHSRMETRRAALQLLEEFDDREAVPAILPLLRDPDPSVRRNAVEALAHLGAETSAQEIRSLLRDPVRAVRIAAATALGTFGDTTAIRGAFDTDDDPEWLDFLLLKGAADPILWKRLRDTRVASDHEGHPREIVAALAAQAGIPADPGPSFRIRYPQLPGAPPLIRARSGMTLLTALGRATWEQNRDWILDPGRVRIVTKRQAIEEGRARIERMP